MITELQAKNETIIEVAKKMLIAARTAPKGRGQDNIEMAIVHGDELISLAAKMEEIGKQEQQAFFVRDAENVRNSEAVVIIGTRIKSLGLAYCGLCGMKDCDTKNKNPDIACSFNTVDLGIALAAAVNVAMNNKVDNRIMYTIGLAAMKLKLLSESVKIIHGIPLSATSKNIFFDRK